MKTRKIVSVILCAAIILSLTGCAAVSAAFDYRKAVKLTEKEKKSKPTPYSQSSVTTKTVRKGSRGSVISLPRLLSMKRNTRQPPVISNLWETIKTPRNC